MTHLTIVTQNICLISNGHIFMDCLNFVYNFLLVLLLIDLLHMYLVGRYYYYCMFLLCFRRFYKDLPQIALTKPENFKILE